MEGERKGGDDMMRMITGSGERPMAVIAPIRPALQGGGITPGIRAYLRIGGGRLDLHETRGNGTPGDGVGSEAQELNEEGKRTEAVMKDVPRIPMQEGENMEVHGKKGANVTSPEEGGEAMLSDPVGTVQERNLAHDAPEEEVQGQNIQWGTAIGAMIIVHRRDMNLMTDPTGWIERFFPHFPIFFFLRVSLMAFLSFFSDSNHSLANFFCLAFNFSGNI